METADVNVANGKRSGSWPLRLVVVSHVAHVRREGRLWAYGPYVAEMEEWARLFEEVVILAPESKDGLRGDLRPFQAQNIRLEGLREAGGHGWKAKAGLALAAPAWAARIWKAMREAGVVHVRCPGNVGMVGALLAPLSGRPMVAKYAGQWSPYAGEALSYRFQRWLLRRLWGRGAVLAYTDRPEAPHVVGFFNSVLTREHLERARAAALRERDGKMILFAGRLTEAKGADVAIRACARLREQGLAVRLELAGEGPERGRLEGLAADLGVEARFHGGLALGQLIELYERASVLVLPSRTEGWPKVLAEAMAFGVPCVATRGGLNDWMLGEGRGMTVEYRDAVQLAEAVTRLLRESPEEKAARRSKCADFGRRYALDGVREEIRRVLEERCGVKLTQRGL